MSDVNEWKAGSGSFKPPKGSPLLSSNRRSLASEKTFLSANQETSRSYGATRKPEHAPCDYKIVRHVLAPGDTLQGLAIKYQVTVEQIKRANRLWTHDNIHLHVYKVLKIPVKFDLSYKDGSIHSGGISNPTDDSEVAISLDEVEFIDGRDDVTIFDSGSDHKGERSVRVNEQISSSLTSAEDDDAMNASSESPQSFLERMDARIKSSVKESQKLRDVSGPKVLESLEKINRQSLEGNELWHPFGHVKRRRHTSTQKASSSSNRSKTSLQDSDEKLFEL